MGVRLMVEILDGLPPETTPAERTLLLALAEKADDRSRTVRWARGENPRETLRRRTGLSDSGLRKALHRMSERGLDPRVSIGSWTDDQGRKRLLYSHEGSAVEYRIPTLSGDTAGSPLSVESRPSEATTGQHEVTPQDEGGDLVVPPLEPERRPSGVTQVPQSLKSPSTRASEVPAEHRVAVLELVARLGASISEVDAADCVAWVAAKKTPDNLAGYVSRFPAEGVRTKAQAWRGQHQPTAARAAVEKCEHGVPRGRDVFGVGAKASRRCGRCEAADPADEMPALEASVAAREVCAS